jgi:hypothetical protein
MYFDIKQYAVRPKNVLTAGGFLKSSVKHVMKPYESNKNVKSSPEKHVASYAHLQKHNIDNELSEIEIYLMGDDEAELEV